MLKSAVDHNEVSGMISHFMPEINHHHSLGKRNQGALENIWENRDHIPAIRWAKCIANGVTLALFAGALGFLTKTSSKKIFLDRALLSPRIYINKFKPHIAYGAIGGTVWFFLNEFLCPHGGKTYTRVLMTYGIMGGLVFSTLWVPSSFLYGAFFGTLIGMAYEERHQKPYPKGFEARIQNFDPAQREKMLRDDHQLKMSTDFKRRYGIKQMVDLP